MKQRPVIILNGPPGSGKDAIARQLVVKYGYIQQEMKKRLHKLAVAMSGVTKYQWHKRYINRELKDQPWDVLPPQYYLTKEVPVDPEIVFMTQREYLIYISEHVMKPAFGKQYFGKAALENVRRFKYGEHKFVFSDGGFQEELEVFEAAEDVRLILVHLYREGCDFSKDSRSYVTLPGVKTHKVYNNKKISEAVDKIRSLV